jgi:hypothetical protein
VLCQLPAGVHACGYLGCSCAIVSLFLPVLAVLHFLTHTVLHFPTRTVLHSGAVAFLPQACAPRSITSTAWLAGRGWWTPPSRPPAQVGAN